MKHLPVSALLVNPVCPYKTLVPKTKWDDNTLSVQKHNWTAALVLCREPQLPVITAAVAVVVIQSQLHTLDIFHSSVWWNNLGSFCGEYGVMWVFVWIASASSRISCKTWLGVGDTSVALLCQKNIRSHPGPPGPIFVNRITSLCL